MVSFLEICFLDIQVLNLASIPTLLSILRCHSLEYGCTNVAEARFKSLLVTEPRLH